MPRQIWMCWTLLLLLVALKLPPASSSRWLSGTGSQRHSLHLAVQQQLKAVQPAINSIHGGRSGSTISTVTTGSSSSSSSNGGTGSGSNPSGRVLQAFVCSPQCAADSCTFRASSNGGVTCWACKNGFVTTRLGGCGCPPGKYPYDSSGNVTCVSCLAGSWCPGGTEAAGSGINSCSNGLTSKLGAAAAGSCVNPPGYHYNLTTASAVLCGPNTYSIGLGWQRSCTRCPGGLMTADSNPGPYTSAAACVLKPGYYLRSWQPVACSKGSWNAGLNRVAACTRCAANVTTAGAGSSSAGDCKHLAKGYEAVSVAASGEITAARICRANAYCPGDVEQPGWVGCSRGMWTRSSGRTSPNECLVPPGYYLPAGGGNITQCTTGANGSYKGGWGAAAACTACGPGIYSEGQTNVSIYNPYTDVATPGAVATSSAACFVYPGMGMGQWLKSSGSGYQFVGVKCNRNESFNAGSTFGYSSTTQGLQVRPCRRCAGVPTDPGPLGGATACVIPAGYAALSNTGAMFNTTGYSWARVKNVTLCPVGYYCVGGDPATNPAARPVACSPGLTTAGPGASLQSLCNVCTDTNAQYAASACQCSAGYQAAPGTSFESGNLTCQACTGDTYTASAGAVCMACPADATAVGDHSGCQCNSGCSGTWPGTACSSCDYTPVQPTLQSVQALDASTLNVTWQTNQAGLWGPKVTSGYDVRCYQTSTNPTCTGSGPLVNYVSAAASDSQSAAASGLSAGTGYTCFVVAFNTLDTLKENGVCSGPMSATTLP